MGLYQWKGFVCIFQDGVINQDNIVITLPVRNALTCKTIIYYYSKLYLQYTKMRHDDQVYAFR